MKKIITIVACSVLMCMLLTYCGECIKGICKNGLAEVLDAWEKEADPNIAIFDERENSVIVNGDKIYLDEALKDHYENTWDELILCIRDNKIYGIHPKDCTKAKYTVEIYSIDIETNEVDIVYTTEFGPGESGGLVNHLSYKTVYYLNGVIVMCDGYRMVSYEIDTREVKELNPEDFSLPEKEYLIERMFIDVESIENDGNKTNPSSQKIDNKAIKIVSESEERVITVDYMAQRHPYVKELMDLGTFRNPFGKVDPLKVFFSKGDTYVINGKIYLVCRVLDNDGESSGLVFSYDYEKDQFTYIDYVFSIDVPYLIVIPVE